MRPCRKYKERIALSLIEGELSGELRQHVSECAECAAYAEELKRVCSAHRGRAAELSEVEAPMRLRARVRDAIVRRDYDSCCRFEVRPFLRRLLQVAGGAAAAAIIVALIVRFSSSEPKTEPVMGEAPKPGITEEAGLNGPTLAAYRSHLTRSVEELEASLREHDAITAGEVLKVSSATDDLQ
jgi:hypothetical protein